MRIWKEEWQRNPKWLLLGRVRSGYLQSPWSAAQADQAATRLLTSTCVTVPGGTGAGALGGGGMPGSALAIILKMNNKLSIWAMAISTSVDNASFHWCRLPYNLRRNRQGNQNSQPTPLCLPVSSWETQKIKIPGKLHWFFFSRSHAIWKAYGHMGRPWVTAENTTHVW